MPIGAGVWVYGVEASLKHSNPVIEFHADSLQRRGRQGNPGQPHVGADRSDSEFHFVQSGSPPEPARKVALQTKDSRCHPGQYFLIIIGKFLGGTAQDTDLQVLSGGVLEVKPHVSLSYCPEFERLRRIEDEGHQLWIAMNDRVHAYMSQKGGGRSGVVED